VAKTRWTLPRLRAAINAMTAMLAGEEGEGDWDPEISGDDMRAALRRLQEEHDALEKPKKRSTATHLKVGDRVIRNKAVGGPLDPVAPASSDLVGTVRKIAGVFRGAGGARARAHVRWDNGHEGSVDDRQLVRVAGDSE
jgi:hypothetical protein